MARLELTRSPDDRRLYVLPGVGEVRTRRWPSRAVEATAAGQAYIFAPRGESRRVPTATDAWGSEVGHQSGNRSIVWRDVTWALAPGADPSYYTLARSGEERAVANLALAPWGRRPVSIVLDETARVDPSLVLFSMFLVRRIAEDLNRPPGGGGGGG